MIPHSSSGLEFVLRGEMRAQRTMSAIIAIAVERVRRARRVARTPVILGPEGDVRTREMSRRAAWSGRSSAT
jgi:hypothetical protein